MAVGLVESIRGRGAAEMLASLATGEGSASHPYPRHHLSRDTRADARNLADAVHLIGMLHVQRPGILDIAADQLKDGDAGAWIGSARAGFAVERGYVTRLVVAVGPLPGTPGQAGTEAAVVTQRNAIEMLVRSERHGCPLGAAVGLLLDWPEIRAVLDVAATKFGVPRPAIEIPTRDETLAVVNRIASDDRTQRAVCFGAEQLLVQHRALWDLLEARCSARG